MTFGEVPSGALFSLPRGAVVWHCRCVWRKTDEDTATIVEPRLMDSGHPCDSRWHREMQVGADGAYLHTQVLYDPLTSELEAAFNK